jgi:hypothetical protein
MLPGEEYHQTGEEGKKELLNRTNGGTQIQSCRIDGETRIDRSRVVVILCRPCVKVYH